MSRKAFLRLHRWIGTGFALLLAIQGVSGAALVFRDAIVPLVHPDLLVRRGVARQPLQAMLDTVQARHPAAIVMRMEVPARSDQAVLFDLQTAGDEPLIIAVDPYTGAVVRDGGLASWPVEWLFALHEHLHAGAIGDMVVGVEGLALLFLALSGPVVWWPGRKRLRQGLRVKLDGSADIRWRTLHRSIGALIAAVLLVMAVTGAAMVWKGPLRTALAHVTPVPGKPAPKVPEQPELHRKTLDDLVARAHAVDPSALRQLRFARDGRVVAVFLDARSGWRADGTSQYYFDARDGREVGRYIAGQVPWASEMIDAFYTVHTGIWGGFPTMMLTFAGGIALAGLSLTGPWLWWSRSRRRRQGASRRQAAIELES